MSWISRLYAATIGKAEAAITKTVVRKKIENGIDKIDADAFLEIAGAYGDMFSTTAMSVADFTMKTLKSNKTVLAELASQNTDTVIALYNAGKALAPLIEGMDNEDNRKLLGLLKDNLKIIATACNDEITKDVNSIMDSHQDAAETFAKSCGYTYPEAKWFIIENGENVEVSESRFNLRKASVKTETGTFSTRKVGQSTYEIDPKVETEKFYANLGINPEKVSDIC